MAWHPNALVDPTLIFTEMPRRVVFGARHGLFRLPILGTVIRSVGTVPIYRSIDAAKGDAVANRRAANRQSIDRLAEAVGEGAFAALFPEGISHDEPDVQALKTGVASLFYRASRRVPEGEPPPVILPVGLHYNEKGVFGSNALITFHPPIELEPELAQPPAEDAPPEVHRELYAELTERIDDRLRSVVYGTQSWRLHGIMQRARKLVRAERAARAGSLPGRPDMVERVLGFARFWTGYNARLESHPEETADLLASVERYDADLATLHLDDHELDGDPPLGSVWLPLLIVLQVIFVYLVLPPFLLIGTLVNLPTAVLLWGLSKMVSKAYKDEASFKLAVGALLFPLTWLGVAFLVGWGQTLLHAAYPRLPDAPLLTGVLAFVLSGVCGVVALQYLRLARETARAVRVRLTRTRSQRAIERLRLERSAIYERVMKLAEGLALPGAVADDGRIVHAAGS